MTLFPGGDGSRKKNRITLHYSIVLQGGQEACCLLKTGKKGLFRISFTV
jgi:hypothetical protein